MKVTVNTKTEALEKNIAGVDKRARNAITAVMKYYPARITRYMKDNAPWTDRTGNARNGLYCQLRRPSENVWELILGHSVPYGIYLETRWSGKYAIIQPTKDEYSIVVMDHVARQVANVRSGPERVTWEYDGEL